jgi:hypothetical protein
VSFTSGEEYVQGRMRQLLVRASVVPSSPILVTLIKEALTSSETLFLQEPHGITSQKTPFFIVTEVKTSNLTYLKAIYSVKKYNV